MKMPEELDEFLFLTKKEFEELEEKYKWDYAEGVKKMYKDTKIMADKNCDECMYRLQTTSDINIEMFFEDWRTCIDNCDNCDDCNITELKGMCQTQFELINHIANSLVELQMKQNMLVKFIYRRDDSGKEILKGILKSKKKNDERAFSNYT